MVDVSIIIPVYNAETYLRECLNSALAQTVRKKEILCIDDGSTDRSIHILRTYARNHQEIRIISQENAGSGMARNKGLELAQGEFVCFLDADDYYLDETALEQMIRACGDHEVKICGSFREMKYVESGRTERLPLHRDICKGHPDGVELDYYDYQEDYHYQSYIFCRKMLKEKKIVFPPYRRYQDPPFFLQAMLAARKVWVMPVEWYCYRLGHQNLGEHAVYIEHTLMGIRDNMRLAKEKRLFELQKKLVRRINEEFYWPVVRRFNENVFKLLSEIEQDLLDKKETIRYWKDICRYYSLLDSYNELGASYYIMRMMVETRYKGIGIGEYLRNTGIGTIAIYGLGTFGNALYYELKNSPVRIVCGIDKNNKLLDGLTVVTDVKDAGQCDAIVVTPLKEGAVIAAELKARTGIPVYTLIEILNNVEKIHVQTCE
ncbi:MAG: glycosyltransferase [Lachnospiraceae bacterium]|jgi:glycosyltransferase involved in cell wall biosynthesis|nr:glycosyltransferase [Lachnospiraceae bacterium]